MKSPSGAAPVGVPLHLTVPALWSMQAARQSGATDVPATAGRPSVHCPGLSYRQTSTGMLRLYRQHFHDSDVTDQVMVSLAGITGQSRVGPKPALTGTGGFQSQNRSPGGRGKGEGTERILL